MDTSVPTPGAAGARRQGGDGPLPAPASAEEVEQLSRMLQEFGLTARESKVLLALVQLGTATVAQVARLVDVERANIYRVLEALSARRLVLPLPGGERRWTSPGRGGIVDVLLAEEEEHHRGLRSQGERARELLERLAPEAPEAGLPYLQLVPQVREASRLYDRLLSETRTELLVCNKAPYGGTIDVRPAVLDALARGVKARALYESDEFDAAQTEGLWESRLVYHEVGVEGRVVDRLPIRLAVFDRSRVLLAMNDPVLSERFPTNLFIDDAGFAEFAALAFEQQWSVARSLRAGGGPSGGGNAPAEDVILPGDDGAVAVSGGGPSTGAG